MINRKFQNTSHRHEFWSHFHKMLEISKYIDQCGYCGKKMIWMKDMEAYECPDYRKDKEHHFYFLRNETEFEVQGKWHNKQGKAYNEENAEIEIQYWDNKQDTKTKKLKSSFKAYNKKYVKEEVLYATTTPLDMTTLNRKGL